MLLTINRFISHLAEVKVRYTPGPVAVTVGCGCRCNKIHLRPNSLVMLGMKLKGWKLQPANADYLPGAEAL